MVIIILSARKRAMRISCDSQALAGSIVGKDQMYVERSSGSHQMKNLNVEDDQQLARGKDGATTGSRGGGQNDTMRQGSAICKLRLFIQYRQREPLIWE